MESGQRICLERHAIRWLKRTINDIGLGPISRRWAQKLHLGRDDLCTLALAAVVLRLEVTRAKASFDVNLPSLLELLITGLRQLPERHDVMPLDAFLLLALLVGE
jgi:hypothetical protein